MSKYTPGPWSTCSRSTCGRQIYADTVDGDGTLLANVVGGDQYANAKLIAAAPDLAEALRDAREAFCRNEYERESARRRIDAALAKAGL